MALDHMDVVASAALHVQRMSPRTPVAVHRQRHLAALGVDAVGVVERVAVGPRAVGRAGVDAVVESRVVKSCVVNSVERSRWTLRWMCVVRPGYHPG